MYFAGHYNFWNEALGTEDTQAFICCDRQENAQLILVAFCGIEPFNTRDWVTDVDLSWMQMGEMGRVHVGFMKALCLQDEKKGMPKDYTGSRNLAYYSIRATLKTLLRQNPNARIIITGHSLGGALAILFPAILVLHQEEDVMSHLMGVYTFGQPRVGDTDFGNYMTPHLNVVFKRYFRVVYRYDVVPRVPFEDRIFDFAHFGGCLYYYSWTKGEVMKVELDMNYFNILYIPLKYFNAVLDFIRGIFAGVMHGKDFTESLVSILFRAAGFDVHLSLWEVALSCKFQLTANVVALVINVVAVVTTGEVLNAVQLLWVNLIMDTLGAIALATEPPTDQLMKRSPVGRRYAGLVYHICFVCRGVGENIDF